MQKNLKLGISLLVVTSVFFLCVSLALFFMKEDEKDRRISVEGELEETLAVNTELESGLEELKIVNTDLESRLDASENQVKTLNERLSREKEAHKATKAELAEQKKEARKLADQIVAEKEEKVGIVKKTSNVESENRRLKNQLELILQAKETLEKKVKEIISQKGVELEKIVIEGGVHQPVYPPLAPEPAESTAQFPVPVEAVKEAPRILSEGGEVLIVNKKFDFIISNLGEANGLRQGDRLDVYRNEKFLAEVEVEKLYDRMSASAILPQYKKVNIKPGDSVSIPR